MEGRIKLYIPFETRVGVPTELASIEAYAVLFMRYCLIEQYTFLWEKYASTCITYINTAQSYPTIIDYLLGYNGVERKKHYTLLSMYRVNIQDYILLYYTIL